MKKRIAAISTRIGHEFKLMWDSNEKWLNRKTPFNLFLIYALPIAIFQGILSIFHINSTDALWQWQQIDGSVPFSDVMPVGHTLYMWCFKWIGGLATYNVVQVIIFVIVVTLCLLFFARRGISKTLLLIITCVYAVSNAFTVVSTGTKDAPYSIAILVLTMLCIKIYETRAEILKKGKYIISIGIVLALITLFRHNGGLVTIGTFLVLLIFYPKYFLRILLSAIVSVGLVAIVWGFAFGVMKAAPDDFNYISLAMLKPVFAVVAQDGNISQEQLDFINTQAMPIDIIKQYYDPYSFGNFIWSSSENFIFGEPISDNPQTTTSIFATTHYMEVKQLFFDLFPQNKEIMIKDIVKTRAYIYNLWWSNEGYIGNFGNWGPTHGQYMLALVVLLLYLGFKRKKWRSFIIFAPVFLNIISILITLTPEWRYTWPTGLCFPMILLFFVGEVRKKKDVLAEERSLHNNV